MSTTMNGAEGLALLEAFGFGRNADGSALEISFDHPEGTEGVPETVVVSVTDGQGRAPGEDMVEFRAVAVSSHAHVKDIEFDTADARDVMAFAIAVRNEQIVGCGDHNALPAEDTFTSADESETCIHNPFGDDTYGDWAVDREPGERSIHLRNPVENYGHAYADWVEARAAQVLEQAAGPAAPSL